MIPTHSNFCAEPLKVLFKSLAPLCTVTVDSHTLISVRQSRCLAHLHFHATLQRPGLSIIIKESSDCKACPSLRLLCVCSVKELQVEENNRTRMMCEVPFRLPKNMEVAWRFAEEVSLQPAKRWLKKGRGAGSASRRKRVTSPPPSPPQTTGENSEGDPFRRRHHRRGRALLHPGDRPAAHRHVPV